MSYYCPVCNGMESAGVSCPECGDPADDFGRSEDYAGPYSPYDALGDDYFPYADHSFPQQQTCLHLNICGKCGTEFHSLIQKWPGGI